MQRWIIGLSSICLLLLMPGLAFAQRSEVKATARLAAGLVKLGSSTQLIVEVEGAQEAQILTVPEVEGLRISKPGQPSTQQFTRIYNGRRYSKYTMRWALDVQPLREGDFVIPPLRMSLDGREVGSSELQLKVVRDLRGEELGIFEIVDPPKVVYEGQPFTVDFRFGWDKELHVGSIALGLPWWGTLLGTLEVEQAPRSAVARFLDVPVNGRIKVPCEELPALRRNGREFRVFQLRRTFLATRPGTLEFSTSNFEFSRLIQRARSLFESDQMEDFYAICPGFSVEVRTVPETNRPFEWTGAVGDLVATRRVDRRDVDAGDSIKLTVSWMGEGNLEFFEAPDIARLDEFRGFRVLGTESEFTGDERRVTYDLVPITGELSEIPSVPLWTFDPSVV